MWTIVFTSKRLGENDNVNIQKPLESSLVSWWHIVITILNIG